MKSYANAKPLFAPVTCALGKRTVILSHHCVKPVLCFRLLQGHSTSRTHGTGR